jgi:hypothetical protein
MQADILRQRVTGRSVWRMSSNLLRRDMPFSAHLFLSRKRATATLPAPVHSRSPTQRQRSSQVGCSDARGTRQSDSACATLHARSSHCTQQRLRPSLQRQGAHKQLAASAGAAPRPARAPRPAVAGCVRAPRRPPAPLPGELLRRGGGRLPVAGRSSAAALGAALARGQRQRQRPAQRAQACGRKRCGPRAVPAAALHPGCREEDRQGGLIALKSRRRRLQRQQIIRSPTNSPAGGLRRAGAEDGGGAAGSARASPVGFAPAGHQRRGRA